MNLDTRNNLSRSESARRYLLAAALIGAVLFSPAVPSWIALFACYPMFTALMQWDPLNAVLNKMVSKPGSVVRDAFFRSPELA